VGAPQRRAQLCAAPTLPIGDAQGVQPISGYMRPGYMAPCHIAGRVAIADTSLTQSSKRQEVAGVEEYVS